jgi:YidC/Oxa1 family membrane protein insertase
MPVVFAANPLQPLIDVFESVMHFFHAEVGVGWGLSIICMTIVVRAALIPLTLRQFRSMQGLQRLQPQIKELQAKYKDDRQRLNQEMMKFYQENKVNPFGSCLPLLLQLPVFFSLFYMLRKDLKHDICPGITKYIATHAHATLSNTACEKVDPGSATFLGIPDLTDHATGKVLVILIVLYVGSQLASSLLMSAATADRNQRMIMLALPFVFVPFVSNFPAGLLVYWITTNVWTIGQQYLVKRTVGPIRPAEVAAAGATAGGGGAKAPPAGGDEKPKGLFASMAARVAAAQEQGKGSDKAPAKGSGNGKAEGRPRAEARSAPPPQSPRKKKKRSGRRR